MASRSQPSSRVQGCQQKQEMFIRVAVAYWGQKKVKIESTLELLGTIESEKRE